MSSELVLRVKQKAELSGIAGSVVNNVLKKYIQRFPNYSDKMIIKLVRAELRILTGRFQPSSKKRSKFLENNDWELILQTHASTKERLETDAYKLIKKLISKNKIRSIIDLGAGLNPIALATSKLTYTAIDIKQDELEIIDKYFKEKNIKGKTIVSDLRYDLPKLPTSDLALAFKLFDVLETKGHKLAEKIIISLPAKYILVSFPTKTLSGRPMNHPQRGWIEQLFNRLDYEFEFFQTKNEIFYLAKKK